MHAVHLEIQVSLLKYIHVLVKTGKREVRVYAICMVACVEIPLSAVVAFLWGLALSSYASLKPDIGAIREIKAAHPPFSHGPSAPTTQSRMLISAGRRSRCFDTISASTAARRRLLTVAANCLPSFISPKWNQTIFDADKSKLIGIPCMVKLAVPLQKPQAA